jgi:hypothetical protein
MGRNAKMNVPTLNEHHDPPLTHLLRHLNQTDEFGETSAVASRVPCPLLRCEVSASYLLPEVQQV